MTKKANAVTASNEADAASTQSRTLQLNQEINLSNYMDYAQNSNFTYDDSGLQSQIQMMPLTVNGQVVQVNDAQNGVQAEAFITTGAGHQHIVIAYAGIGFDPSSFTSSLYSNPNSATGSSGDLFTGAEIQNGAAILAGQIPTGAVGSATAFAEQVVNDASQLGLSKSDISLTGHNLGGTLAEYAASKTGLGGTSFGAAGIVHANSKNVTNFKNIVQAGDLLGNYAADDGDPLGPILQSPNIKHYGKVQLIGPDSDQMTLRSQAANAYAGRDGAAIGELLLNGLSQNDLSAYTLNNIEVAQFGSFADPTSGAAPTSATSPQASTPAPATTVAAPTASSVPTASQVPTTSVALPSEQVVNQDINLCNYMYSSRTEDFSQSGVDKLGLAPLEINGKIVQIYNQKAGVAAEAFETTGKGAPQIIIAYEGTSPYGLGDTGQFTGGQLLDDASFFAGKPAACAAVAGNFANKVLGIAKTMNISADQVSLTGHSLGAAEAEYAAEATGLKGVTFGTPGIDITSNLPPSQLTNFVDSGDPVGNYGNDIPAYGTAPANPLGNFVTSPDIAHYGGVTLIGDSSAQTDLSTVAYNFFNQDDTTNYKNIITALLGPDDSIPPTQPSLGYDFQNHHLSTYATNLDAPGLYSGIALVCYCTGTAIRTACGDRAVETLRPGEFLVTAAGERRPIKWIGQRTIVCREHPRSPEVMPVRIAAHAFGENLPARDLYLSPGHPVLVGANEDGDSGHLVPIMCLINGTTIERVPVDEVTYWHVELDEHDILLAEGLPAESYIDLGSRSWFVGADGALYDPDMALPGMPGRCRPVAIDGPVVEAARRRLDAAFAVRLTAACAWPISDDDRSIV